MPFLPSAALNARPFYPGNMGEEAWRANGRLGSHRGSHLDLDGPVKGLRDASPQARHHCTRFDQVNQLIEASEADPDLGFMARLMALYSLPPHQPRQPAAVQEGHGPYTLGMSGRDQQQAPLRQLPAPPDFIHPDDDGPRRLDPRQDEGSNM